MKFSRMEKNANTPQPGIEPGTLADVYIRVIPPNTCLSLGGRPLAMVPKGSGKGQKRALVCGGQMEQESRSRMVEMSLLLVGLRAWFR